MRFYLDQDVDVELASRLRQSGHGALTTRDAGNTGLSNGDQLGYAASTGHVLVTHNRRHFRRLHRQWRAAGRAHAGVVVARHMNIDELERRLRNLIDAASEQDVPDELFSLADYA